MPETTDDTENDNTSIEDSPTEDNDTQFRFENPKKRTSSTKLNNFSKKYVTDNLIPTQNRYAVLNNNESAPSTSQIQNENQINPKIPPIFLNEVNNYQEILQDLKTLLKNDFTTRSNGPNTLKINTTTINDYRTLTRYYDAQKLKFFTFRTNEAQLLSVIIKNLPTSLSEDEIKEELSSLSFPVIKVVRLINKFRDPLPMCIVDLKKCDMSSKIFNLQHLFHAMITVEMRRKSKEIPQCINCQLYGHTKNFCRMDPKCHKCAGNHHFSKCTKPKTDPVSCVNCGENHPANYRGCKYYKEIKEKVTNRKNNYNKITKATDEENHAKPFEHSTRTNNQSQPTSSKTYASALNNSSPKTQSSPITENPSKTPELIPTIINLLVELIKPHIQQIKTFLTTILTSLF